MSQFQGSQFSLRKKNHIGFLCIFFHNTFVTDTYKMPLRRILFVFCAAVIH